MFLCTASTRYRTHLPDATDFTINQSTHKTAHFSLIFLLKTQMHTRDKA
uniref:Uncharacterized protein n=1 Tax=Anguilla anguilla TaxID=7936 RepID=A0A0E9WRF9_ANGAN